MAEVIDLHSGSVLRPAHPLIPCRPCAIRIAPPAKDAGATTLENPPWDAADQLHANSGLSSPRYSQPVVGLIFFRFADAKFGARR